MLETRENWNKSFNSVSIDREQKLLISAFQSEKHSFPDKTADKILQTLEKQIDILMDKIN